MAGQRRRRIPGVVRRAVMERSDWKCVRCGSHRDVLIDHVVPVVYGGSDDPENLQALCRGCNSKKGPRPFASTRLTRQTFEERRILIAVRLASPGIARIDEFAASRNTTRSEAIRTLLGMGLAAMGEANKRG